jgi:GNAT superfamily N-acetyltransferase
MDLRPVTVTHETPDLQDAFIEYVPKVFESISFRRWRDVGAWDDGYIAFSFMEGDRIVASASRQRMEILLHGERMRAWQLTAVGTLPEWRRRGLQHQIMRRLLDATPAGELLFLFGNQSVLHFYPRFGLERHREYFFRAPCAVTPSGPPLRALEFERAADRELVLRIAAAAEPVTTGFGVRDHGRLVLWYWTNLFPTGVCHLPEHDAIVVATQTGGLLEVHDVLAATPIDLPAVLPRIASEPVTELEFGFTPDRYWPSATPHHENIEGPLFVRPPYRVPDGPFKFPRLGET